MAQSLRGGKRDLHKEDLANYFALVLLTLTPNAFVGEDFIDDEIRTTDLLQKELGSIAVDFLWRMGFVSQPQVINEIKAIHRWAAGKLLPIPV